MDKINPNYVTSLRLFIFAPLACFSLMRGYLWFALVFIIMGELTDWFDGFVARRTNQVSDFGKIYDPMCDSISHMIVWISFLAIGWVSAYFVMLFFVRDVIVSNIRTCLASHKIVLAARTSGKIKAVAQATAQIILIILHILISGSKLEMAQSLIVLSAVLITIHSLFDYCWRFYQLVKEKPKLV